MAPKLPMRLKALHPAKQAHRVVFVGAGLLGILGLTGCQGFRSPSSFAHVRIIDASSDAGTLDLYHGNTALAYNLGYGAVSSYIALAPGSATIIVDASGSRQVLSSVSGTFAEGGQYTVLLKNSAATLQALILADPAPAAPSAPPSLRLLHQAARTGAVDLYLVPAGRRITSITPLLLDLSPGTTTAYLPLPSGPATLVMLPAGTAPSLAPLAAHTGTQIDYLPGSQRTLVLLDSPPTAAAGLQVIATVDAEPAN